MIVDDEQHAIDILVHYVNQTPYLQLIGSFTNPIEAIKAVTSEKPDLVFLDIQMPELSGVDFVKAIQGKCKAILTTAYSEFAVQAFDLEVVDYLLKPISFPRFLSAVQKMVKIHDDEEENNNHLEIEEDYIFVKTESKGKVLKINLEDIDYIEGMKNYVAIFRNGTKTLVYTNMKDLEARLPQRSFIRVHKSFIIPIAKIAGIEGNHVTLENIKADILLGDSYKPALMDIIKRKMVD